VSPALEEVILKAIRRKPENRWPSAQAVVDALKQLDQVDVSALKEERERVETDTGNTSKPVPGLGMPVWKVAVIVGVTLAALIALSVVVQLLHHGR
jgi:hypothetical protein